MKAAFYGLIFLLALAAIGGCGSSSSSGTNPPQPTTGLHKRVLVSNSFVGVADIVDAQHDQCVDRSRQVVPCSSTATMTTGTTPQPIVVSGNLTKTLVYNSGSFNVTLIDNATETATNNLFVPGWSDSIAISSDAKRGFVAVRNANITTGQPLGGISDLDLVGLGVTNYSAPSARRVFLTGDNNKVVVLPDPGVAPPISDQAFIYDTTAKTMSTPIPGVDHPAWAVFSSDNSKAYILDCGPECGGPAGSGGVSVLDMTGGTITATTNFANTAQGATVAVLSGTNLYVAGTDMSTGKGQMYVFNVGGAAPTIANGPVEINDGYHSSMVLAQNNEIFVGATTCTSSTKACLTIYDTGTNAATYSFGTNPVTGNPNFGDVTGMQPISGRSVVYVIEGGEVRIYDTTTKALTPAPPTPQPIDIVGAAWDVKQIDP